MSAWLLAEKREKELPAHNFSHIQKTWLEWDVDNWMQNPLNTYTHNCIASEIYIYIHTHTNAFSTARCRVSGSKNIYTRFICCHWLAFLCMRTASLIYRWNIKQITIIALSRKGRMQMCLSEERISAHYKCTRRRGCKWRATQYYICTWLFPGRRGNFLLDSTAISRRLVHARTRN